MHKSTILKTALCVIVFTVGNGISRDVAQTIDKVKAELKGLVPKMEELKKEQVILEGFTKNADLN